MTKTSKRFSGKSNLPGQKVAVAGVYLVEHSGQHRESHEVVLLKGHDFPVCEQCKESVRYHLLRAAPYLFDDPDFGEPTPTLGPRSVPPKD